MRRLLAAALLVMAGCGGEATTPPTDRTPGPDAFRAQPVDWFLLELSADELRIGYHLSGIASDCQRPGDVDVDETADAVTVTAHRLLRNDADVCTEELMLREETVVLASPLGDRELRGCAPTSDPVDEDAVCRDPDRAAQAGFLGP